MPGRVSGEGSEFGEMGIRQQPRGIGKTAIDDFLPPRSGYVREGIPMSDILRIMEPPMEAFWSRRRQCKGQTSSAAVLCTALMTDMLRYETVRSCVEVEGRVRDSGRCRRFRALLPILLTTCERTLRTIRQCSLSRRCRRPLQSGHYGRWLLRCRSVRLTADGYR